MFATVLYRVSCADLGDPPGCGDIGFIGSIFVAIMSLAFRYAYIWVPALVLLLVADRIRVKRRERKEERAAFEGMIGPTTVDQVTFASASDIEHAKNLTPEAWRKELEAVKHLKDGFTPKRK